MHVVGVTTNKYVKLHYGGGRGEGKEPNRKFIGGNNIGSIIISDNENGVKK